jgi:hypothetical protein
MACYRDSFTFFLPYFNAIIEEKPNEGQHGFSKGPTCSDVTFTLRQIITKRRELNLPLLFVGYMKEFDTALRNKVWDKMRNTGYQSI